MERIYVIQQQRILFKQSHLSFIHFIADFKGFTNTLKPASRHALS